MENPQKIQQELCIDFINFLARDILELDPLKTSSKTDDNFFNSVTESNNLVFQAKLSEMLLKAAIAIEKIKDNDQNQLLRNHEKSPIGKYIFNRRTKLREIPEERQEIEEELQKLFDQFSNFEDGQIQLLSYYLGLIDTIEEVIKSPDLLNPKLRELLTTDPLINPVEIAIRDLRNLRDDPRKSISYGKIEYGNCYNISIVRNTVDYNFYNGSFEYEYNNRNIIINGDGFSRQYFDFFYGRLDQGKPTGQGTMISINRGSVEKGEFRNGIFTGGFAKINYPKFSYEGNIQIIEEQIGGEKSFREIFHGKGKIIYKDGTIFEGELENDNIKSGNMTYYNGDSYSGTFGENRKKSGYGSYTFKSNGVKYEGSWKSNKRDGRGIEIFPTIKSENGQTSFSYDRQTSPSWYDGEWKDNLKSGRGTQVKRNSTQMTIYEGEFKNNKYDGRGKLTTIYYDKNQNEQREEIKEGIWNNGILAENSVILNQIPSTIASGRPVGNISNRRRNTAKRLFSETESSLENDEGSPNKRVR